MTRSFDGTPVELTWLDDMCSTAMWAPTAGNSAGVRMYTFGAPMVGEFLEVATDPQWRSTSRRFPGVARAGGGVIVTARPEDYTARYREPDKASSGLGDPDGWSIPYWLTDAAMATMALLLLLEEAHWGATFWGSFRYADEVLSWANADGEVHFGSLLIGRDDGDDVPSTSIKRQIPSRASRVRRVRP